MKTIANGFKHPGLSLFISIGFPLRFLGYRAASYELEDDPEFQDTLKTCLGSSLQDILRPMGFCYAISLCIRLLYTVPWLMEA